MPGLEDISLLVFAFTAGAFTFLAPCAYPLLPGYVSYYIGDTTRETRAGQPPPGDESDVNQMDGQHAPAETGGANRRTAADVVARVLSPVLSPQPAARVGHALVVSALVSLGFIFVYGVLVGIVAILGARLLAGISILELVVGLILIGIGVPMAAGWEPPTMSVQLPARRRSGRNYVGFGVLYAAAAAGCTAPIFIGVAFKAIASGPALSLLTIAAYVAGMSALLLVVTTATALGRDALLTWVTGRIEHIHRAAGVLLVLAGLVQLYFYLFRFGGLQHLGL